MDGEILIALKEDHKPTADHMADLRRELPKRFPGCMFFFQAADIVNQVLNFGQPSPVDIRVVGSDPDKTYALAKRLAQTSRRSAASWIRTSIRCRTYRASRRCESDGCAAGRTDTGSRRPKSSGFAELEHPDCATFWVNPGTGISYPLVAQVPTYMINSLDELRTMPLAAPGRAQGELLMNIADINARRPPR